MVVAAHHLPNRARSQDPWLGCSLESERETAKNRMHLDLPSGAIGAIRRVTARAHWAFRVNIGRPTLNPERSGELQGRPNLDLVA